MKLTQNQVVDRKSTRLNSSHLVISYAVLCLKKKKKKRNTLDALPTRITTTPSTARHIGACTGASPAYFVCSLPSLFVVFFFFFFFLKDRAPPDFPPLPPPPPLPS